MKISKRVEAVTPSLTRQLFNMAKQYSDVIDLTLGDPDLNTPIEIKNAAKKAIDNNMSHYSANAGVVEAREQVKKYIYNNYNILCDSDKEILLTVGGMEGLYLSLLTLIDEGDEVILLSPYYVNYYQMVKSCLGIPVIVDCYDKNSGLSIDLSKLEKSITDKTKVIIINSPNNPTGDLFSKEDVKKVLDLAVKKDLIIISDEVYRSLIYDNIKHESVLQFQEARERTILIDSLSKEFCMTGWRIGYVFGPEQIVKNMIKMQENVASCAPLISQYALIEAYSNKNINKKYIVEEFSKRRDYICDRISKIDKISCIKPKATFYLFLDISELNMDSLTFSYDLLKKKHIAVVPGETYGDKYKNYVRIAFTKDIGVLKKAMDLLEEYINEFFNGDVSENI